MEVEYGEGLQKFLLDNCKIDTIMEFDRAVFADADVNTAIVLLQKENSAKIRNENTVKFIRVKKHLDSLAILRHIDVSKESFEDDRIRINVVKQSALTTGKWNVYLRAPPSFHKILSNPRIKRLGDLSDVFFGIKTGYNDFFIVDKPTAREWGIEKRYLKPVMTSPKKISGLIVKLDEVDEFLLLCHERKESLDGTRVLRYIQYGERLKIKLKRTANPVETRLPCAPSVKGRDPWYDLSEFEIPPIVFQELYDMKTRALWNEAGAHARAPLYYCIPKNKPDAQVIVSFLNSSLAQMFLELYGRSYGGGVLDVKVYELKLLPSLDPSCLSPKEREGLWQAFLALDLAMRRRIELGRTLERTRSKVKKVQGLLEPQARKDFEEATYQERRAQEDLDRKISTLLGLNASDLEQIEQGMLELQEIRRLRKETQ